VDASLVDRLLAARFLPNARAPIGESALLIALGPHLEDFLASLFGIENEVRALEARHHELAPLFAVKRSFVQRKALNAHKADVAATFDGRAMRGELETRLGVPLEGQAGEVAFANAVNGWQHDAVTHGDSCRAARSDGQGRIIVHSMRMRVSRRLESSEVGRDPGAAIADQHADTEVA